MGLISHIKKALLKLFTSHGYEECFNKFGKLMVIF